MEYRGLRTNVSPGPGTKYEHPEMTPCVKTWITVLLFCSVSDYPHRIIRKESIEPL
jgi:hypothetical protein